MEERNNGFMGQKGLEIVEGIWQFARFLFVARWGS